MSIKSYITDKLTGISADVSHKENCDCQALVVATVPYMDFQNSIKYFTNNTYGIDINQNAASGGSPEKIHNGTDDVLWTGSNITGVSVTFDSTNQNHTGGGSKSIYINKASVNNVFQFAKGSDIDLTGYVSISFWVYIDNNWNINDSIEIYCWDTDTSSIVGISVKIEDYVNINTNDVWQKTTIPLTELEVEGATIVDAIRVQIISKEATAPQWYLDDIQFEETGEPLIYELKPDKETWLYIYNFAASFVDVTAGTLADATMPNIPYDSLFGISPDTGLTYQRVISNEVQFSINLKTFMDFLELPNTIISGSGSDGTNTWAVLDVKHTEPIVLKHENDDRLRFIISDDLSGLLQFRVSAGCKIQNR